MNAAVRHLPPPAVLNHSPRSPAGQATEQECSKEYLYGQMRSTVTACREATDIRREDLHRSVIPALHRPALEPWFYIDLHILTYIDLHILTYLEGKGEREREREREIWRPEGAQFKETVPVVCDSSNISWYSSHITLYSIHHLIAAEIEQPDTRVTLMAPRS